MKTINFRIIGLAFACLDLVRPTVSHSWLECTDYRFQSGSKDETVWNKNNCFGHARCGARQASAGFGVDTGFNFHSGQGCQCSEGPDNYKGAIMAKYSPGQLVCLAYPPKTHVAAPCTNPFIPDAGVQITRSALYNDGVVAASYSHLNGVHEKGVVDFKGFQNCPRFCEDIQGALCTMCFQLENNITPGKYTFHWIWSFNSLEDQYSACWEAEIGEPGSVTVAGTAPSNVSATIEASPAVVPVDTNATAVIPIQMQVNSSAPSPSSTGSVTVQSLPSPTAVSNQSETPICRIDPSTVPGHEASASGNSY